MTIEPPPPPRVLSAEPPAGTVVVRGRGWRFSVSIGVLLAIASALGARLASTEQRLREQADHIRELERACAARK